MPTLGEATIRIRGDGSQLPGDMTRAGSDAGRQAGEKMGEETDKGFRDKVPLIAAGAAAGLAVATGAVVAGAAGLFAGIGIAAASENANVQASFTNLTDSIKTGIAEDAAVYIPMLQGLAEDLGESFQRLRPHMRDAFEATAPLVDKVADSLLRVAEEAFPSLTDMAQDADPIVDGLTTAIEALGEGAQSVFDAIGENGPAIGTTVGALGEGVGSLLPVLAEFIGTGAELGSIILPPLAAVLQVVADAAQLLGPILPAIAASFVAMKAAKGLSSLFTSAAAGMATMAQNAAMATYNTTGLGNAAAGAGARGAGAAARGFSAAAAGIGRMGAALPALGILLAGITMGLEKGEAKQKEWTDALLAGGAKAAEVAEQYEKQRDEQPFEWMADLDEFVGFDASLEEAQQAVKDFEASLSPLELTQHKAKQAQEDYNFAVAAFGEGNPKTVAALLALEQATAAAEREQADLERATHGVTQAMVDQALQVLAAADSDLAYRLAVDSTEEAVRGLAEAVKEHGAGSEEASDASLGLEGALLAQAAAAGVAAADNEGLAEGLERDAAVAGTTLQEFKKMRDEMGEDFPAALQASIDKLEGTDAALLAAGAQSRTAKAATDDLGISIGAIPDSRFVEIEAPTADQKKRLEDLGMVVTTLPDGTVVVSASTGPAEDEIAALINKNREIRIQVTAATTAINNAFRSAGLSNRMSLQAQGSVIQAFDSGGFMSNDVAQVVPPNTWRVIGDRVTDDEAFIPINNDPRSVAIWEETGRRMGLFGTDAGAAVNVTYSPQLSVPRVPTAAEAAAILEQDLARSLRLGLLNAQLGEVHA